MMKLLKCTSTESTLPTSVKKDQLGAVQDLTEVTGPTVMVQLRPLSMDLLKSLLQVITRLTLNVLPTNTLEVSPSGFLYVLIIPLITTQVNSNKNVRFKVTSGSLRDINSSGLCFSVHSINILSFYVRHLKSINLEIIFLLFGFRGTVFSMI